jgi:hypothetical protein
MKGNINTTENYSSSKTCRGNVFQHIKVLFLVLKEDFEESLLDMENFR